MRMLLDYALRLVFDIVLPVVLLLLGLVFILGIIQFFVVVIGGR